jgi:predicted dehydrogenase
MHRVVLRPSYCGANDDIRVAVIGEGNKGSHHMSIIKQMSGVRLAALCDVDSKRMAEQVQQRPGVSSPTDPRQILDRRDIDVVVIATPENVFRLRDYVASDHRQTGELK